MTTTIFAKNFRGFREIEICLKENLFLVGDNSSGKTSVLHLVDFVLKSDLDGLPRLEGNAGVAPNDFFSPYFDYSDVIIGFETAPTNEDPRSWKAITIHRGKDGTPSVTAVTIARGQWAITAVPHKFGAKIRARKEQSPLNRELLLSLHSDRSAMKIVQIDDERRLSINSSITLQFCIQKAYGELLDDDDLAMTLFVSCPENSRHLGPLRGKAERYYHPDRRYRSSGVHFAPMFRDVKGPRASEMKAAIEKFGIASRLFD